MNLLLHLILFTGQVLADENFLSEICVYSLIKTHVCIPTLLSYDFFSEVNMLPLCVICNFQKETFINTKINE